MIRYSKLAIICSLTAFAVASPLAAQSEQNAPAASAPVILAPAQGNIIRAGSEVVLKTREELTTKKKKLKVGHRVQMEVSEPLMLNGQVIVPVGTPAVGEVTEVRNKGMWGKSGYIGVRVVSMRVGDRQIRLSGTFDDKGVTGTAGVVASIALVPVVGFFTTGTSAFIPAGSNVKAFLDEDIAVAQVPVVAPVAVAPVAPAVVTAKVEQPSDGQLVQTGPGQVSLETKPN